MPAIAQNLRAPTGHAYELAELQSPKGWRGTPVLVLQPQFGLFLDLEKATGASERLRNQGYPPLHVVLVALPVAVQEV